MIRPLRLAAALALIAFCAGCSKGNLPPELTSPDDIAIVSIMPPTNVKLAPGSTVTFTANVAYILASTGTGAIAVTIEDQNNVVIPGATPAQVNINAGQSSVMITSPTITVPATGVTSIQVFYSLLPAGATSTSTIATAIFAVGT